MDTPVVLITGALSGIGRATAFAFAQEGARIVISGRRDEPGQALATELRALGAEAEYVRADVRHEDDVRALVDKTIERFGRLDVAVNNAGTEGRPGPLTEQSAETYNVLAQDRARESPARGMHCAVHRAYAQASAFHPGDFRRHQCLTQSM